jgi:hypothetical protein
MLIRVKCPRPDSNGHALMGTGPQPAVYANSTTGASNSHYMQRSLLVNLVTMCPETHPAAAHYASAARCAIGRALAAVCAASSPLARCAQFTTRPVFVNR